MLLGKDLNTLELIAGYAVTCYDSLDLIGQVALEINNVAVLHIEGLMPRSDELFWR